MDLEDDIFDSSPPGIQIELDPEVAAALRGGRGNNSISADDDDGGDDWNEVIIAPPAFVTKEGIGKSSSVPGESRIVTDSKENIDDKQPTVKSDDNDVYDPYGDDTLSLSPPPSLPVLVVDLEKLVGYKPATKDEAIMLQDRVRSALWGGDAQEAATGVDGEEAKESTESTTSLEFEEHVAELFANHVAYHSDTILEKEQGINETSLNLVVVDYPDYLADTSSTSNDEKTFRTYKTARVWKRLLRPHLISVVNDLVQYLKICNRPLLWKYKMHAEIWQLAKAEETRRIQREQSRELKEWRTYRRKTQLDQLYEVRETFLHRLELAETKLAKLEDERDQLVARKLCQKRVETGKAVGLQGFDFESTTLAFPSATDNFLGLNDELDDPDDYNLMSYDEDDYNDGDDEHDDNDGDDEDGPDINSSSSSLAEEEGNQPQHETTELGIVATSPQTESLDPANPQSVGMSPPHDIRTDRRRKRQESAKKRRQRLEIAAKEAEHDARLQTAKLEEEQMRADCTSATPELLVAMAVVQSMKDKLAQMDQLLETLQEEEWQDEEEEENDDAAPVVSNKDDDYDDDDVYEETKNPVGLSLLDQVLAMILGSQSNIKHKDENEFFRDLQELHISIASAWKDHFGRLPPGIETSIRAGKLETSTSEPTSKPTDEPIRPLQTKEEKNTANAVKLRQALDSEPVVDDWEEAAEEDFGKNEKLVNLSPQKSQIKVGLRPGGRIE